MDFLMGGLIAASAAREAAAQALRTSEINQAANLVRTDVNDLREQVERLALLTQSLWELLRERLPLTEAELEKKVQEVDMRDGIADGKLGRHPLRCPKCLRVSNSRHKRCLYCGLEFQSDVFG
ncbi:MAG TPA: hypothetical protein PLC40_02215 [Candidatus Hydrogenedentes bacterium]|nr:hypothetical protein [Candidatus Hydrogenedentota bacterium]